MIKRTIKGLFCIALASFLVSIAFYNQVHALEIHQNLQGPFLSTRDVTAACLKCHHQQALEVLQSAHWTWIRQRTVNGKNTLFGKKDSLTGFAIDVSSNPSRCMGCHVSNTRPNVDFDSPRSEMVDCLICHDTTGKYRQTVPGSTAARSQTDLEQMARNVGTPTPANCMTCHFADCGLPESNQDGATFPNNIPSLRDIHMEKAATSFACQDCHIRHSGHSFSRKMGKENGATQAQQGCASCHTDVPHIIDQLNQHLTAISCQTCHIPQFSQQDPVIIGWNWIMTGKTNRVYQSRQNSRTLAQNENGFTLTTELEPVYMWDDGGDQVYSRGQRIRPQELTYLQKPSDRSPGSKITPFRVIYGTQMYDAKYRYLISPLLQPTGSTFFPGSDWENIARQGMEAIVLPFSGKYAFAPTAAFRRINHGVVRASDALGCLDCHGSSSRMPWKELGYDQDPWSGTSPADPKSEGPGTELNPATPEKLQPIKESTIPSGSSF